LLLDESADSLGDVEVLVKEMRTLTSALQVMSSKALFWRLIVSLVWCLVFFVVGFLLYGLWVF
jgi:small-conductance mechanosensitive channel